MSLNPGTTVGPYEVAVKIGVGGMGEVYRARDTTLDRDVALKVLPEAFTSDPDRLARFEREAKVLASLNHPNIGGIHGLEEAEGTKALVLELIEGPTLEDRIAQGPIPLDEALPIAKQIAEALEAAHEAGIIHRDLKPANIKLKPDGTVKVLDFGLAKAVDTAPAGNADQSPTLTAAATQMGVIMGTAAYMSPEQTRGKLVDKRTDVWAFGVVVYEMLVGRRLFPGESTAECVAAVLRAEIDWDTLPADLPLAVGRLLRRCLVRDPTRRIRHIGDARLELLESDHPATVKTAAIPAEAAPKGLRNCGAILLVLVVGGYIVDQWLSLGENAPGVMRFVITTPETARLNLVGNQQDLAISGDGTHIVYKGGNPDGSGPQLNLRPIDDVQGAPLLGAEDGYGPFFSPNGEWVGFIRWSTGQKTLQKVPISGGLPVILCESPLWG